MTMSDAKNWPEIERLLDAALDLPEPDRAAFVRAHASDAVIADCVCDLLARESRLGAFLEHSISESESLFAAGSSAHEAEPALAAGQSIGPWRLVRELGHGGMATVWLAERNDGAYSQQVALKLVRPGLDSALLRERFTRERRILARLQHPRVARLLDGGVAEGRQYLALEFVEGLAITDWCARHRASVRQRVGLLRQVCDAVAFAHAKLIVHRDLKPSNILVNDEGEVRLLDFGIAKILAGDSETPTSLTAIGGRAMTPTYAAPEQISGQPLSVATDVYALGVVLYELLSGHLPYRAARNSLAAIEDAVLHEEPIGASRSADAAQAQSSAVSLPRLRRELRGDLDRILATALEKDPDRRYASVDAFAQDLDRHLEGRPVRARRASIGYRAGKFIRRHAIGLGATAALVVAILAGVAGTLWQAQRAESAARSARAEAAAATAVRDLLLGMFQTSDPDVARGRDPSASDLLDAGARRVQAELAGQPALKARLLGVIADLYRKLGDYKRAADLFTEALQTLEPVSAGSELDLAKLHLGLAQALTLTGALDAATLEFDRLDAGLADLQPVTADIALMRARASVERGELLLRQGRYDDSRARVDGAFAIYASWPDRDAEGYLTALQRSADLEFNRGHFENAERQFRDLLARLVARHGEEHTEVARAHHDLGVALGQLGRLDEAESSLTKALDLRRRLLGEDHPVLAYSHSNLAAILRMRQRLDEAEQHYLASLEINRRALGDDAVEVARDYNGLAILAAARRDLVRAEELYKKAYSGYAKALGSTHPDVGMSLNNLAATQRRLGRFDEAGDSARRALAILRTTLPEDHYYVAIAQYAVGTISLAKGDAADAVAYLEPAARTIEKAMGAGHGDVLRAKAQWTLALAVRGDVEAARMMSDALELPTQDPRARSDVLLFRGRARLLAGATDAACSDLEQAWRARVELDTEEDAAALEGELYFGACLLRSGRGDGRQHVAHAAPLVLKATTAQPIVQQDASRLLRALGAQHGAAE